MNQDKMVEKLQNAVVQIGAAIMFFFFAAATTATDPFFRKNMGERYLSLPRILISFWGWSGIAYLSYAYAKDRTNGTPWLTLITSIIIVTAYIGFAGVQYYVIIRKRQMGAYWHSKSRGESIFGYENPMRDVLIEVAATFALFFASPLFSFFFFISRALGYMSDAAARALLYNKYLDIQDAKIEAQFMEVCLREGLAPSLTAGFTARLPRSVTGEHRANVAKVVADGMREIRGFRPPGGEQEPTITVSATIQSQPDPLVEIRKAASSKIKELTAIAAALLRSSRAKAVIRRLPLIAILAVVVMAAVFLVRSVRRLNAQTITQTPPVQNSSSPQDVAPLAATPNSQIQDPPSLPTPTVARAPIVAEHFQPEFPKPDPAAVRAALEAKKQKDREGNFQQLTNLVATQTVVFLQFKGDCQGRLDNNTNKIAEVRVTHRSSLRHDNDAVRKEFQTVVQKHDNFFAQVSPRLQSLFNDPRADLLQASNKLTMTVTAMENDRKSITTLLDNLDTEISNAPPRMHIFGK